MLGSNAGCGWGGLRGVWVVWEVWVVLAVVACMGALGEWVGRGMGDWPLGIGLLM